MQKNRSNILQKNNIAFTYIEVIIALVIIALISGLLYFSYSVCIRSFNSARESVKESIVHLNTDKLLRNNIEKVSFPYWIKEYAYSFSDNEIVLSWINGNNEVQKIKIPENVRILDITPIVSENEKIKGLHVIYNIDKKTYELKALFATRFYGAEEI